LLPAVCLTPGEDSERRVTVEGLYAPSTFLAMTMRWIWLVPS
jgi:hypothetical protein